MEQSNQIEVTKFIRIIVIVAVVFVIFYILTSLMTKDNSLKYTPSQTTPAVIQYDEIILSQIFNQKEDTYFVLAEEKDDPYLSLFENLLTQYQLQDGGIPYYTADLSSAFNQRFIKDAPSFDPEHFMLAGTTLLKIQNHTIIEHYEVSESILEYLQSIIK